MIILDYRLDLAEAKHARYCNLVDADDTDLDYGLFCGSIFFSVYQASFDANWYWIPVLDFAVKMKEAPLALRNGKRAIVEFTESSDIIELTPSNNGVIKIMATYADREAIVPLRDLEKAISD